MNNAPELYVGLMSGTSLDGIDAVLVDLTQEPPQLIGSYYRPFDQDIAAAMLALHTPAANELHDAYSLGNRLSELYASSVHSLLELTTTPATAITAIGCHGQTIRHRPERGYTVQIGNAALLAELTGITVVSDFRSRDIAAGGQGAPLVPAFHDKIFRHASIPRVIVNIGGIANLTNLPPDGPAAGFDCGPGNLLMDAWCLQHTGNRYDNNGDWAASGTIVPALLANMLEHSYFSDPPPKSTGRDLFNLDWLNNKLTGNERAADVQRTLLELTCQGIARSIVQHCAGTQEVYICGGGAHNLTLLRRITALLPECGVFVSSKLGVDGDSLEAVAFAWLAQQTLRRRPANLPEVTGARHACILGAIYQS